MARSILPAVKCGVILAGAPLGVRKNNVILMAPLFAPRRLRAFLKRGGIIAYPTESCFGLGCDPANRRAVQALLKLKGRPQSKGLILVGSDFAQFKPYLAALPATLSLDFPAWWPGPNTLLLPASKRCPSGLTGHHASLAVRVSAHPETAHLCHALHIAMVSTSANRAGKRSCKTAKACQQMFGKQVLVLPGLIGRRKTPSCIIDPISGKIVRA
jgi:L-threonylcarbamoyladenylate synthase